MGYYGRSYTPKGHCHFNMAYRESAGPFPSSSFPTLDLAKLRQAAGRSLEEIAANTKISIRFLRAIEVEKFEQLPGGIFSTSYLRQYAAAIGYNEEALVAHYRLKMNLPIERARHDSEDSGSRTRLDRWLKIPAQASR